MLVMWKCQAVNLDRTELIGEIDETGAAHKSEIPCCRVEQQHLLQAVAQVLAAHDTAGAGELLIARQHHAGMIDPGLVEERLVPGNERRRLPAALIVKRQYRQPVAQ